jgi:hypothetical protein
MNNYNFDGSDIGGCLWAIGWLFTIGFLRLSFWRGVLAIFVWPYFIGKKYAAHHTGHHVA